jgi:hypothetical protein
VNEWGLREHTPFLARVERAPFCLLKWYFWTSGGRARIGSLVRERELVEGKREELVRDEL